MTDVWSERAEAFRESPTHREGADLDLLVDWCEPAPGVTALDVATGGGHVARRLREEGCEVVTLDPAPGMQPDVLAPAEDLPFADASFDVVACRIAPHHFTDVRAAVAEMARVARDRVVVEDDVFVSEQAEQAERLRDRSHVRCYGEAEWRIFLEQVGLVVEAVQRFERRRSVDDWLARVGCEGADAERVKELLGDRIEDGELTLPAIVIKGRKAS
jgi:ubiquinone/menaquinone biosynthesis C-methylase UbiE